MLVIVPDTQQVPVQIAAPTVPAQPTRPQLPHYSWRVQNPTSRLQYITDHRIADFALSQLAPGPLGFDLEWRPNFRKWQKENPVALVQLANHDTILLLQISAMSEFPLKLRELLSDPSRAKAGVSIQNDCEKLFQDYGVSTCNCVELALLARSVDNARWKGKYTNPLGLSRLLETYENFSLAKGKVQRSNWEARLSASQQDYAANDACAGYAIYTRLMAMALYMPHQNTLSPQYYSFSFVNGSLLDHLGVSVWSPQNPYYDPGPPPPPKEPKVRKQGPHHSPAAAGSPRTGPSHRGPPLHRYASPGTNKQFHNVQQYTPIVPTAMRAPTRSTAEATGSRVRPWRVAPGEHGAAAGHVGRFWTAEGQGRP
ncbi:ribonuclease H-like protein [Rhizopogon vinicolor AM-OR11-026]|uniref:Ribonuclease H-like protein n=1 Tax=Rhizopogon vinicolor AM-OR11-026 TaxID=1314800 RepID=A0A1B7NJG3_9AGAM|nr:ribonuclease H-like protein [Rhizopogon vinicolor AM-OR11-026]